jgi:hypothetical protein
MKTAKWILILGVGLFIAGQVCAQDPSRWSYDLYGIFATHDKDGDDEDELGLGAGVNYFFNDNMGFGADSYIDGVEWPYLLNGSFIYRFSQLQTLTPYAYAGFGRQWAHAAQWTGHFGGGAEYNLGSSKSIFADARLVLPDKTDNYTVVRVGVRFGF